MSHVLLIEDDPWFAELYTALLRRAGYTVTGCRDGQQAMQAIDQQAPSVVVLDLFLPEANGIQVLHELASYSDVSHVPVILCSSAVPTGASKEMLGAYGVVAVIDKTISGPNHFIQTIQQVVGSHAGL